MKRFLLLITLTVLTLSLIACSPQNDMDETQNAHIDLSESTNIVMSEDGSWPDNEYTKGLPIPSGTVMWSMIDPDNRYCSINIDGMSQTEYDDYVQALMDLGFTTVESVSEEIEGEGYVSVGTIYTNGEKSISIAYANENFGIYIVVDNE